MANALSATRPIRIRCHGFPREDVDALRSLLGLLRDYLRQPCLVVDDEPSDLVFVDLDHAVGEPDATPGARVVGCAVKPRLRARGTIHRPFRAAEVLAVLSELTAGGTDVAAGTAAGEGGEWRYRLRLWPLGFEQWPRESWKVMAAIARRHCSVPEIAARTGLAPSEIAARVAQLRKLELLDTLVERRALVRDPETNSPSWRGLAARVGQLLGFAR